MPLRGLCSAYSLLFDAMSANRSWMPAGGAYDLFRRGSDCAEVSDLEPQKILGLWDLGGER